MRSLLQKMLFDNPLQDYLILVAAILMLLLVKRYLSRNIAGLIFRMLHKTAWKVGRETFVNLLRGPIHVFLFLLVIFLILDKMNFPVVLDFKIHHVPFKDIVDSIGKGLLIIAFTWLLLRAIDFLSLVLEQKANLVENISANQLLVFFKDFFKAIIVCIGILLVIRFTFNKDIAALLAGFGIVGAAVALSARESLENLIASFIIFFDKPFYTGDLVKVQNITGTVERIGLRSTRIRTEQKTYVTVPNKQMVDSILDNLSLRTQRKGMVSLEISASTSYSVAKQLVKSIESLLVNKKEKIESFSVVLSDINKNSFVLQVEYFTGPIAMDIFNKVKQEINLSIIEVMEESQVKLAGKETEIIVSPMVSNEG